MSEDICNDGRFEIIADAKKKLLAGTNIGNSPDEMKVIDNILFRCWQMNWLDNKSVGDAYRTIEKEMKHTRSEQSDGKYYSLWKDNLACFLMDHAGIGHDKANEVAKGFLDYAFNLGMYADEVTE